MMSCASYDVGQVRRGDTKKKKKRRKEEYFL